MNFFKTFFASILGTIIGLMLILFVLFVGIMSSSSEPEPYIRSNTILTIDLSGNIPSRTVYDPLQQLFPASVHPAVSLSMLKSNLEKAATDDNISGVWLKLNRVTASWANLETAYEYLQEFKESGKFLYASTDDVGLNENAYFLATTADSIFSPPTTAFEFNGFVMQTSYYREMLDKIGIEPEIHRVGKYKSSVEPFLREDSSPENREQITALIENVYGTFNQAVQKKSGLSLDQIDTLMEEIPADPVARAHENGLIDVIAFPAELENQIKNRTGLDEDESLQTVSIQRYNRVSSQSAGLDRPDTDNRIAIIYASGIIIPEEPTGVLNNEAVITAGNIKKSLDSALDDDRIKAIVLHIDSGGGAPSTSDLIWHHLKEASNEKPVVAYMGNVAASGGYYIAMGADRVVASPNTITGSIGIYSMMFNTRELYNDKLGIHFEEFKTHDHSDLYLMSRPLTSSERDAIQRNVENGYELFLKRVADARDMTRDEVHELAQGRVWTGTDALNHQLVDQIGNLDAALATAAELAEIESYHTVTYPEKKELFELLFGSAQVRIQSWAQSLIPYSREIRTVEELMNHNAGRNWMVLPVEFRID
ncbi:MAG: signal peptide peptidase SppA [Balneolaceae bacterium]